MVLTVLGLFVSVSTIKASLPDCTGSAHGYGYLLLMALAQSY